MNTSRQRTVPVLKHLQIAAIDLPGTQQRGFLLTVTAHPTPQTAETRLQVIVTDTEMPKQVQLFQHAADGLQRAAAGRSGPLQIGPTPAPPPDGTAA